jgi:hypothetical protein
MERQTEGRLRSAVRLYLEILGDQSIDTYKKTDARDFEEVLCDLPPNLLKLKETRTLNARAAAKKARSLKLPCMSITSVNKLITIVERYEWPSKIDPKAS